MLPLPVPGSWFPKPGEQSPIETLLTSPPIFLLPQSWEQALAYAVSDEESWLWGWPGKAEVLMKEPGPGPGVRLFREGA